MSAIVVALTSTLMLMHFSARAAESESINVSAAASLREAVTEIAQKYEDQTHTHVDLTFGGSGQLRIQIKNGAPVDALITASTSDIDQLDKDGSVEPGSKRIIAGNQLVLIVPANDKSGLSDFQHLGDSAVQRVAIGEPKTVPAGQYAMQVLTALKLDEPLRTRLIYGSSVRQVLDYVERSEVSAGIVYATDARQAGNKVKVVAVAKESMHDPIVYPAVVIKGSGRKIEAGKFLDFLTGDKAQAILLAHGFAGAPPATAPSK